MRTLGSAAFLLAVATTVGGAQTTQPTPQTAPRANIPAAQVLTSMPANAATITHWYKQPVYDPSDNRIGEIEDVLVDRDAKIVALVIGVGGFLGIGEKHVAVPYNAVRATTKDNNKVVHGHEFDQGRVAKSAGLQIRPLGHGMDAGKRARDERNAGAASQVSGYR
jgi:sporulation protein YlmC with PRC-barrel domain